MSANNDIIDKRDLIYQLYIVEDMTVDEIVKETGNTVGYVKRVIKDNNMMKSCRKNNKSKFYTMEELKAKLEKDLTIKGD